MHRYRPLAGSPPRGQYWQCHQHLHRFINLQRPSRNAWCPPSILPGGPLAGQPAGSLAAIDAAEGYIDLISVYPLPQRTPPLHLTEFPNPVGLPSTATRR
eukprot:GHVU01041670.1.p2 GENE.GHVU01041670.1~~GHVU01041670.1.p2  ORF type:complete len:100 (-),score=5.27 GHVU01041670.1:1549-1848(-)